MRDLYFDDFVKSDFPEIEILWQKTGIANPLRGDSIETIIRCNQMGGKFLCLKLQSNKKIIGTSWMSFDGRRIYLHHFCIHPDFQGKGYGYYLGLESLKFIKKSGAQVKLEVHKENIKAKRLYEKLGFFAFTDYDIYMIRDTDGSK